MCQFQLNMETEIIQTKDIYKSLTSYIDSKKYSSLFFVVDTHTYTHCMPLLNGLEHKGNLVCIAPGEEHKNIETCKQIWDSMTASQLDRKALVINVGGGVVGDMGGFCAATYKRGVDFVQVPTSLLAQVDASVGGKLGIDFTTQKGDVYKNHIGVFKQPAAVFIDTTFLRTLPHDELRSGFAEIIKHCLIADKKKWNELKQQPYEKQNWDNLVAHSIQIKQHITRTDPHEAGLRKILNFGHTIGHAIESYFLNKPSEKLLHGYAIAIGMVCESYLSMLKTNLTQSEHLDIVQYLFSVYGKKNIKEKDVDNILALTMQDKKNENGKLLFSLLTNIGNCAYNIEVSFEEMKSALHYYMTV